MKEAGLICSLLFISVLSYAQKLEYAVHLNSGLFNYGGESATRHSDLIYYNGSQAPNFTLNPYGKKSGFSYGVALHLQSQIRKSSILGLQIGYESTKSQVKITQAYVPYSSYSAPNASGKTTLTNQYITVHPAVGKRIFLNKLTLNLTLGPEAGLCLKSTEKGEVTTSQGKHYTTHLELNQPAIDWRARANAQLSYQRMGLLIGYSYGFTNYFQMLAGTTPASKIYSRFLRLGVSYQIGNT